MVRCEAPDNRIESVSITEPPHHPPSFPPSLLLGSFCLQQGEPLSDTNTQLTAGRWTSTESSPGCLEVVPVFLFFSSSSSAPSMFLLFVCQNKALSGFTHRVYCERTQYIVRSGHARVGPICLCWVKK